MTTLRFIIFTLFVYGVTSYNTTDWPYILALSDEQPHQRCKWNPWVIYYIINSVQFYNWDHKDLGTNAFEDLPPLAEQPTPLPINQTEKCPDGWVRFSDSCYFYETELLGFAKAERKCYDKQATLFVANSFEEWDLVRTRTEKSHFSWIGLVRFSHFERSEQLPRWQTTGSINPSKL